MRDDATEDGGRGGQRSIQSVEVGFRLIRALEEAPDELSLKDLAAAAGMSASKAHLYLVSFRRTGLVTQEGDGGRYTLGPYALQLGLSALRKLDVSRLGRDTLRELSAQTGEACYLAVWGNRGPCIVQRVDGPGPLPMSLQVGYVLPTVPSATGRVFLAFMPRTQTENMVAAERAVAWGGDSSDAAIAGIVADVREQGLSRTDGQLNIGFAAMSAPVFAHDGGVAAAITVIGPSGNMDTRLEGKTASDLRGAAAALSGLLGWRGEAPATDAAAD